MSYTSSLRRKVGGGWGTPARTNAQEAETEFYAQSFRSNITVVHIRRNRSLKSGRPSYRKLGVKRCSENSEVVFSWSIHSASLSVLLQAAGGYFESLPLSADNCAQKSLETRASQSPMTTRKAKQNADYLGIDEEEPVYYMNVYNR